MAEEINDRSWLIWLGKVRIIVITFVLAIELAVVVLTPTNLPTRLFVVAILLWYTISAFYLLLLSRFDAVLQARVQVVTDLCMTAAIVYLTGGIDSSFNFLFPLLIIVAAMLLPRAWTFLTASLAFIIFGAILELSYFDILHSYSVNRPDLRSLQASILINLFGYAAIAYLASHLSTKLRQADVKLQEQSGELENLQVLHENIVNSISGGLITTGMDGRVQLINASGQRLLGRRESECVGRGVEMLFLDQLPEPGTTAVHRCEVRTAVPAGGTRTFGMTRSELEVAGRGAVGYVYTFDDLTEIRRLEREVRLRDRMAAVGRMAAAIAHEVRNPLSSIAGSVKVLADVSVLDDEQRTLVDIVTRESERLNNIVSDFLTYSREGKYQFTNIDLLPLLDDTLTLLQNRERPGAGQIQIERRFEVAQALAQIDGDRIKQVFWNICDNAVKAMPDGGTLTVTVRADESFWLIRFTDTGHGMRGPDMEKIFEPFQSGFDGGTGLGLAIVYQVVQAHEGKISVNSKLGQGTTFNIHLRQAGAMRSEPVPAEVAAARGARG